MSPLKAANDAAVKEFDAYLEANGGGAAVGVPMCVIEAAEDAYRRAGGKGEIDVHGSGNTTHPVCRVYVTRRTKQDTYGGR